MTASALYTGTVRHRRQAAPERELRHRVAFAYLDVDELPRLLGGRLVRRHPGIVRVRRRDLIGGAGDSRDLRATVAELIERRTGRPACDGPLRVLTHPRTFGMCFNPVSFYYAFDADERLDAVVAEVTNTPWGERQAYVLRREEGAEHVRVLHGSDRKLLHVSPFQEMQRTHHWAVATPGTTLSVHIANHRPDGMVDFDATLKLERHDLTSRALRAGTLRYPGGTLRVLGLIYGHAVVLKLRGARHVPQAHDGARRVTAAQATARRVVLAMLARMTAGRLELIEPGGRRRVLGPGAGPRAVVELRDPRAWTAMLRGSRGLAESYLAGLWESPDLVAVIRVAARNMASFDAARRRLTIVREPFQRLRGAGTSTTRAQSRQDIQRHYDLGNELFELMLDETMSYSSAYFTVPDATLGMASVAKLELVCEKLGLGPDDHVIEIGGGWGGFAIHAAATRGCRVTTTTISAEQHAYAAGRFARAGVGDRVTILQRDYRDLRGEYSALVSLEMIEAVGWKDFGTFFARCSDLLAPDGRMLLQAITIDDRAYAVEKASRSFMRTYVFPNGCLPSQQVIANAIARETDLRSVHHEDLTAHYVSTLQHWRDNVERNAARLAELGYDERFRRLWRLYLGYCEAGFAERRIAVGQTLFAKPRWLGPVPRTAVAALDWSGAHTAGSAVSHVESAH